MKAKILAIAGVVGFGVLAQANADEIQFVTLPEVVRTTETVTEEPSTPGVNTFVRTLDNARYQLIEKKGNKEVYRDRETGTKWVVEVHQKGD
jgi:hypothetical protein